MAVKEIHSELIDGCKKNNRKAQLRVYELYYQAMFNTSYRIVQNTNEAEDIMQEAFIDAFKKIDTFEATGTFGAWLKRIVINKSLDALKKYKPETFSIDDESSQIELDQEESDDSYAEHVFHQMEIIADALDKIPENYRIILSLHLLEGYDHQEIAQILDISYNNVRTRYSRAKGTLINQINQLKTTVTEFSNHMKN